ncbi:HTH-type transcriptional regulator TtgR [Aquisphaera giovannonii]|uniref:HTH-type transcriptional regulator TtgR n=1 Tax=Aquisphaera giovannonii TaxID=406548 RepID=A0A5B9W322_9BACT|nr:TetR family transcriptional regulator [Aquisphaera giovannonii]QEH34634.1 HTH-type transcriptional regulator TtgR [Aquisphaera giovannonii]
MRKSREAAPESRGRIVKAAAREFREKGVVATGLADLMRAAGMTHGGFYKHFDSKDQLVAEAFADASEEMIGRMESQPTAGAAVAAYLSAPHRDNPASGCPLSAIGSELSRTDAKTRDAATAGFERLVDLLAARSPGKDARRRALVAASTMIGALTMSRVVSDPELSSEILDEVTKGLTGA